MQCTDTSLITSKAVLRHKVVSSREDNSTWSKLNYPLLIFLNVRCRNRFRNFLQSYFKVFHSCWHVHFIPGKISYFFWCQAFNTPPHSHQWCISSQEGKKVKSLLNTGWWVQLFERFNTAFELSCCIQKDSIKNRKHLWEDLQVLIQTTTPRYPYFSNTALSSPGTWIATIHRLGKRGKDKLV